MAPGDAVAADCPTKYDVVINGKGYMFLDAIEESGGPFGAHRASYGFTPPFVERQNVSNSYGDNTQDFFLTIRQRDWSLGEQQKFFRSTQDGRYWMGSNIDVSVPGQVMLARAAGALTFAGVVRGACRESFTQNADAAGTTNLYRVAPDGGISDLGAHGLGASPGAWAVCNDGNSVYISSENPGTVGVRRYSAAAFTTFSATPASSLCFVNNTLYGFNAFTGNLYRYDTAGVATAVFTWKEAAGGVATVNAPRLHAFGGNVLIPFQYAQESSELWIYDGNGARRLEVFPENFVISDCEVLYGVAYIAGSFIRAVTSTTYNLKPAVMFFDGSQIGKLWEANDFNSTVVASILVGPHPALGVNDGKLVFTDETTGSFMAYNPARGSVSSIATFTPNSGDTGVIGSTGVFFVHTRNQAGGYYFPSSSYPASGYVISSLIDFDSSLLKQFRGIKVEFDLASDGNGGSVDIAYQVDSVSGSWTTLQTGAVSGTEYTLSNVAGHAVAVKLTLNKGTSTRGPVVRSCSMRGAPEMPVYARGQYVLDCTGAVDAPRYLRDGSAHPLTGYEQMQNLVTAARSTSPISITDKANGTYTGFVDINDGQGFDVYEVHPAENDPRHPGSFVVRLITRGV